MSAISKITKLVQTISAVIRRPYLLNHVLQSDDYWQNQLQKDFPQYKNGLSQIPLDALLTESGSKLQPIAFLGGGSLVTDLALLKSLASRIPHCKYFEIGTWRGESVINVAAESAKCVTLNLSASDMENRGWPPEYAGQHAFFSKNSKRIEHVFGDSKTFDFNRLNETFDLVFIDGDHSHDYVINDTQKIVQHAIHAQSIVVWHDYAHSPEQFRPEVLHGILSALNISHHSRLFHVSNTLCAVWLPEIHPWMELEINQASSQLQEPKIQWNVELKRVTH